MNDMNYWKMQLDTWMDSRLPDMLRLLETMVNMDSSSHCGASVNKVGELLTGLLQEEGFGTVMLPKPAVPDDEPWRANMGNVFSAYSHEPGTGIILPGHMDTVYPDGATRTWRFALSGDRATGPGVADMKGGLLINVFAAIALKQLDLLNFPITLTFSTDEELGSVTSSLALCKYLQHGFAAISSEPTRQWDDVIARSKGSGHLRLNITGKAAHSSMDYESGASAIVELAHKTVDLNAFVDLLHEIVVNTGLINGGTSAGTVAPTAESAIHMSFASMKDGVALLENIRTTVAKTYVPGTTTRLSGNIRLPPLENNSKNEKLLSLVTAAGSMVGINVHPCYAKWASEAGLCSSTLGLPAVCGMGPVGGEFHSAGEYLQVSSLVPRCKMLALTMLQAAQVFGR